MQEMNALLVQRGKITADATHSLNPSLGTQSTSDLLLDLQHPQIALGLVIGQSRQLHGLHLLLMDFSPLPILSIPCMGNNLSSSIIAIIGENIASHFTRPLIMYGRSQLLGQALCLPTPVWYWLLVALPFKWRISLL
jgi:hypothetical protein